MIQTNKIINEVSQIYDWLDKQLEAGPGNCKGCGDCCDFEKFGHRLFISSPEIFYFKNFKNKVEPKPMPTQVCPYRIDGKCSIYENRFAGCRIFQCNGDDDFQNSLSETVLQKFKDICLKYDLPYTYCDIATALNNLSGAINQYDTHTNT